jgi:hypothetical protein
MILQAAPAFSLTREVTAFAVFVLFVIVAVILVETLDKRPAKQDDQEIKLALSKDEADHEHFFNKIEEYRNDFDGDRQAG